jgi:superfamily I DNA/RNA helicase
LHAEKGTGGTVVARRFDDEYEDAAAAVEALQPLLAAGRSCAILARTNRVLDPIESVCRSHGVKYYRASGRSVLDQSEGALMCNLLHVACSVCQSQIQMSALGVRRNSWTIRS